MGNTKEDKINPYDYTYELEEYRYLSYLTACDNADVWWCFTTGDDPDRYRFSDPPVAYINCNDLFGWATADSEDIIQGEVKWCYNAFLKFGNLGLIAIVCIKRNTVPFDLWLEKYGEGFDAIVEGVGKLR